MNIDDVSAQGRATVPGRRHLAYRECSLLTKHGDQEWSPSRRATRDIGGRAFLRATRLRTAMVISDTKYFGDREPGHPPPYINANTTAATTNR